MSTGGQCEASPGFQTHDGERAGGESVVEFGGGLHRGGGGDDFGGVVEVVVVGEGGGGDNGGFAAGDGGAGDVQGDGEGCVSGVDDLDDQVAASFLAAGKGEVFLRQRCREVVDEFAIHVALDGHAIDFDLDVIPL